MEAYLPQEVFLNIFLRLPNKSIGSCMCVCRYWLSLIKHPDFVSTHLNQTISSKKDPLLLLKISSNQYSLHFDNAKFSQYMQLGLPFNEQDNQSFSIIGSCNGLVCFMHNLYTYNYSFVLWNPSIRKSLKLPEPQIKFESHGAFEAFAGFGFDFCSLDYKIVRVLKLLEYEEEDDDDAVRIEVEIFSLKKNSWKVITHKAQQYGIVERSSQAFVNGAVHWIATKRKRNGCEYNNLVAGLDMGNENFRELMLPEDVINENPMFLTISKYKDSSIGVFRRNYVRYSDSDIWVMKEYGEAKSWTKILTVGRYDGGVARALGFRINGDVIFELYKGGIVSVNQEYKDLRIFSASVGYAFVDTFIETLVLLDF